MDCTVWNERHRTRLACRRPGAAAHRDIGRGTVPSAARLACIARSECTSLDQNSNKKTFWNRVAPRDGPQPRGPCPRSVRPRRGRTRSASEVASRVSAVSHTRPNHSPVSLQRPVCRGPRTVPRSRSFFLVSFWYYTNGKYTYFLARPMNVSYVSRSLRS